MIEATINLFGLTESEYRKLIEMIDDFIDDTEQANYDIEYEREY